MNLGRLAALAASLAVVGLANAVELTFELPDNAKECFFEVIEKGTEATVEFQVRITESETVLYGSRCRAFSKLGALYGRIVKNLAFRW